MFSLPLSYGRECAGRRINPIIVILFSQLVLFFSQEVGVWESLSVTQCTWTSLSQVRSVHEWICKRSPHPFFFLSTPALLLLVCAFISHTHSQTGIVYINDLLTETHYLYFLKFVKAFLIRTFSRGDTQSKTDVNWKYWNQNGDKDNMKFVKTVLECDIWWLK